MDARGTLTGFDHATIVAHEIDEAVRSYERLLGRRPSWRGGHPELGTEGALFGLSNGLIELVAPRASAQEAHGLREHLHARGEGLQAMAFRVADAASLREGLRECGVRATDPAGGGGPLGRRFGATLPDGRPVSSGDAGLDRADGRAAGRPRPSFA